MRQLLETLSEHDEKESAHTRIEERGTVKECGLKSAQSPAKRHY